MRLSSSMFHLKLPNARDKYKCHFYPNISNDIIQFQTRISKVERDVIKERNKSTNPCHKKPSRWSYEFPSAEENCVKKLQGKKYNKRRQEQEVNWLRKKFKSPILISSGTPLQSPKSKIQNPGICEFRLFVWANSSFDLPCLWPNPNYLFDHSVDVTTLIC